MLPFQRTLMGVVAEWYVKEPIGTYTTFEGITKAFFSFFQLHICHDTELELLTRLCQSTATHMSDHIHEWWICRYICKINVEPKFLLDWFLKSLFPPISKDVAMGMPQTKDETIFKAQTFELIYAQSYHLYTMLPHAPWPTSSTSPTPSISHATDGQIDSMNQQSSPFPS